MLCHRITFAGFTVIHVGDEPNTINPDTHTHTLTKMLMAWHIPTNHITPGDTSANV